MRAVIDATPLLVRSAGVKNYLYYWIEHMRRAAGSDVIDTLPAMRRLGGLQHETSVTGRLRTFRGIGAMLFSNMMPLPVMDFRVGRADLFHASVLVRRPPRRTPLTATLYDMTCYLMPEVHTEANIVAEQHFAKTLRRARGIIAISESTRNDAIRILGLPPEKMEVIYPGVAPAFFDCPLEAADAVRRRYGLDKPFVLYVGTIEPRKNVDLLLDAFAALPAEVRAAWELVIAGSVGWNAERTMERLRAARYLGYVPEPDLAPLTKAASVFAYPSLYEGFGLPAAQALAAGTPLITSNVSSLPEVGGDAAILVDPRSESELRSALLRLLTDSEGRAHAADAGRKIADRFRWEECAARSLHFFRRIAG